MKLKGPQTCVIICGEGFLKPVVCASVCLLYISEEQIQKNTITNSSDTISSKLPEFCHSQNPAKIRQMEKGNGARSRPKGLFI